MIRKEEEEKRPEETHTYIKMKGHTGPQGDQMQG